MASEEASLDLTQLHAATGDRDLSGGTGQTADLDLKNYLHIIC